MEIIVLNGSPKGKVSVTMQYIRYLQWKFPQHEIKIINIAQKLRKIEKDENYFQEIIDDIRRSDGIIWAFPVYIYLVPSNYKRFIELIWERQVEDAFKDKHTIVLSTSKHFYDHTAHNYIHAICDDLNMRYVDFYSADMYDLNEEDKRKNFIFLTEFFFEAIENK
ncbi:MAG: NAD(P)H-dependent oxidoreductase, partial [bacterium]|nr:NAD(P)H-dependent oxidoreductase [bacterium]